MASTKANNRFQKLKLRTSSGSPAHSTASLLSTLGKESQSSSSNTTPRGERNNPIPPDLQGHDAWSRTDGPGEERDGSGKSPLVFDSWGSHAPEADVETSKRFASQDDLERELLHPDDGAYPGAVHSAPLIRSRAAGFDPSVGLVDGGCASVNVPRRRPHEQQYEEERANGPEERGIDIPRDDAGNLGTSITPRPQHDVDVAAANHFELPGLRTQHRSPARPHMYQYHPNGSASVDDLENIEAVASLTSATTASTQISEARTPVEPSLDIYPRGALPSSPQVSAGSAVDNSPSPVPFPAFPWPGRSSTSISRRNRGNHNEYAHTGRPVGGSLSTSRRTTRLPSARSSASPALNYLSKWTMAEPEREPKPDDEGQEIGQNSEYIIGRQIGSGGFSVVKEVFTLEAGVQVRRAVKIVKKLVETKSDAENERLQAEFEHEVSIWRFLQHPNLLPLVEAWDTPYATFCITELLDGGTLFDLVRRFRRMSPGAIAASHPPHNPYAGYGARKPYSTTASPLSKKTTQSPAQSPTDSVPPPHGLPPHLARRYIHQLALALRYLHEDVRVVHRDVKLENCLLDFTSHPTHSESTSPEPVTDTPSSPNSTPGRHSTNAPSQKLMATTPARLLLCDFGMADYITSDARPESRPVSPARSAGSGSATVAIRAALGAGGRPALYPRNIGPALPSTLTPSPGAPEHPHHHHHHHSDGAVNSDHHSTRYGYFPDQPDPEATQPHARTQPTSPLYAPHVHRAHSYSQSNASTPRAPSPAPGHAAGGPTPTASNGLVGSLPYAAPELISATRVLYSPAVDVWALGVCAYAVVTGSLPFAHPMEGLLAAMVEAGKWDRGKVREAVARWGGREAGALTAEAERALELISGCMDTVVERRWTIGQVVASPWFEGL